MFPGALNSLLFGNCSLFSFVYLIFPKNNLTKYDIERYSRQIVLKHIGPLGQSKIINSRVLIVGAGGLGCPIVDNLSRAGIKNIGIIDHDKVSLSNLNRQTLFNTSDINKYKVDVLKKKLKQVNPLIKINTFKKGSYRSNENLFLSISELRKLINKEEKIYLL